MKPMQETNAKVELFHAFAVEELEARLQNYNYSGFGDLYYGCSTNINT